MFSSALTQKGPKISIKYHICQNLEQVGKCTNFTTSRRSLHSDSNFEFMYKPQVK